MELLLTQFPIHFESREFPTILVPVNPGNFVSSMKCTLFALLVLRTAALSTRSGFSAPPEELHAPLIAGTTPTTPTSSAIKRTGLKRSLINLASQMDVVLRSFCVVGVAEIFDKTWFVALICALQYGRKISFIGGSLALSLHVFLAAGLGVTISQFFSIRTLCFSTAAIFFLLAMAYSWEFFSSEVSDDVIAERSNEAQESMKGGKEGKEGPCWRDALGRVFMAVFVAEWGDRTQVAMITLHSSAPWLPVCLGSLVAFLLLTFSAVVAATLVQYAKLSERFVLGVSALSFFVFSALAVRDGYMAPVV